jgi:hypothetical protein
MKDKIFFLLVKKKKTEGKSGQGQQRGDGHHLPGGKGSVVNWIPEALHEIIKGIPEKEGPESFGEYFQSVEDWSQEKESLEKNGQNLLEILYFDLHHG